MKSKEALQRVKTAPEYCGEKSVYKKYDNSYTPFMNDIELIKRDLEVLEILKKHIKLTPYKTVSGFKDEGMSDDEFNKVKEWLNDK